MEQLSGSMTQRVLALSQAKTVEMYLYITLQFRATDLSLLPRVT